MKVVLLLGCAFLLFGCNDSRLDNDFFIGDWDCDSAEHSSSMKDGFLVTDTDTTEKNNFKVKFKEENNQVFIKRNEAKEWNYFDISNNNGKPQKTVIDGANVTQTSSFVKKSGNEFILTMESDYKQTNSDNSYIFKNIIECKRL